MSKPKADKETKEKKKYEKPQVVDLSNELLAEGGPVGACLVWGGSAVGGPCIVGGAA